MCEWTPWSETNPSRWTRPPRAFARSKAPTSAGFSKSEPSAIAWFTRIKSLEEDAAGADGRVADLGVPHLTRRKPHGLTGSLQRRVRVLVPETVEDRRVRQLDCVSGAGRCEPPRPG